MNTIAIALFIYNRPNYLEQTLSALEKNIGIQDFELFVFADGAKKISNQEDLDKIYSTRQLAINFNACKKLHFIESEYNRGLANSIVFGINYVLRNFDSIIVIEDDIVTSPYFLKYMKDSISLYHNDINVVSISGYTYPHLNTNDYEFETFMLKCTECWGWATWRSAWKLYIDNGSYLLNEIISKKRSFEFNFDGSYNYIKMLKNTILYNNSWHVKWYASCFLKNKLTVYPIFSLVENIGSEGTNIKIPNQKLFGKIEKIKEINLFSLESIENKAMRANFSLHLRKYFNFKYRVFNFIQYIIKKYII
jgi:Glycosyl transferase family 2